MRVSREKSLDQLKRKETFDLLVIGGGATGCGVALDAASRGLTVALVEKGDFAEGTSGRSTKLLHGGVRYLEMAVKHLDRGQYHLVREALKERGILLRLAPHLCHRMPLVTPLYKWMEVPYILAGLKLYDLLAGSAGIGGSHLMGRSKALERFPMLHAKGLKAGVLYYDGQFNDARMAVSIALTAGQQGAVVANHLGVERFNKKNGAITGALVKDSISGESWDISARVVINATGPFADRIRLMDDPGARPMLKVSTGTHILLDKRFAPPATGLLIPKTEDGRVLFVLPWEGQALVGTTDEPAEVSVHPRPMEEEIDYLVHYICKYFDIQFSRSDIKSVWSGLRPLVLEPGKVNTAKLSRDHMLVVSPSGLITIVGGKWTTYRKMACDTVDCAVKSFNLDQKNSCRTDHIPITGGADFHPDGGAQLTEAYGIDPSIARHLNNAYGDKAPSVMKFVNEGLGDILVEGYPYLEAEVIWAARHEMACRAMDVLARRLPLALLDTAAAGNAARRTIQIMADELGWDSQRQRNEGEEVKERLTSGI